MRIMKKIAVINDLSGLGRCSLTAALPVISVMGVEACPLPTAILSNQTGYPSYYCDDYTDRMHYFTEEWQKCNFSPDGIYTGFLANESQVEEITHFIHTFRRKDSIIIVDPVMGDNGQAFAFVTPDFYQQMCVLVSQADHITPNLTEACLLYAATNTDTPIISAISHYDEIMACRDSALFQQKIELLAKELLDRYSLRTVFITGIRHQTPSDSCIQMCNLAMTAAQTDWISAPLRGGSFSGTGDLFASVISAGLVQGFSAVQATRLATSFLDAAISDTLCTESDRNDGVNFERHLKLLLPQ